jgi:hypothetical protein
MKNLFLLAVIALFFSCSKTSSPTPVSTVPVQVTESILIASSWFGIFTKPASLYTFYMNGVIKAPDNSQSYTIINGRLTLIGNGWKQPFYNCILKQDTIFCSKDSISASNIARFVKAN